MRVTISDVIVVCGCSELWVRLLVVVLHIHIDVVVVHALALSLLVLLLLLMLIVVVAVVHGNSSVAVVGKSITVRRGRGLRLVEDLMLYQLISFVDFQPKDLQT